MKKFIKVAAVLLGTSVAGILTWRKVESDRTRNDLWTEAERLSADQDVPVSQQNESAPAPRV
ncbi:DLW-39 family protein [Brachybacterium sp. FME24]|uniref:DLW-39 family protein n=1 Tax=Brachybacterium sp. FME24 TaxID=2742605 RepID=UPI0018689DA2|nr:DLW-39 family protein [Brachybacterium sp. FME24]